MGVRYEITDEDGQIMLDGELMPGLFEGLEIHGELDIDEEEVPGSSSPVRQIHGYKPAELLFKIVLANDEQSSMYEKLKFWVARFKATDGSARPFLRRIVTEQTAAWGIDAVILRDLRSTDENRTDVLRLELTFEEWRPGVVRKEGAGSGSVDLSPELQRLLGYGTPATEAPNTAPRRGLMSDVRPTQE